MQITSGQTLKMAIDAVWVNKFRSLLTVLGIVIGITTVVTVSSLLTGLRKGVVVFFEEFGPNSIFISKVSGGPGNRGSDKEQRRKPLEPEYAELIRRLCPSVRDVSISLFIPGVLNGAPLTARVGSFESDQVNLAGATANSLEVQPRELRAGRFFTPDEDSRGQRVAVIGANIADALFPDGNAVGKSFIVAGAEFLVLGVFEPAKGGFFGENGMDKQITIPLRAAELRYPQLDRFWLTARSFNGKRDEAYEEIRQTLRRIRKTPAGTEDDFTLSTPDQIIKNFDRITGMIVLVSIAISGLGLLVGGIGVMNIMLVSVTERTREIGVRKALGARRFDIVFQFLLEAVALTGLGGTLGIILSIAVTLLVGTLVPSLPTEVPPWAVITGFTVSVMVGLFFGVWPAFKASRLDPVEALRYE